MSKFGDHLKDIISTYGVNIYALAKSSGIERTSIHKYMSVGRIPSAENANKLAEALQLSPAERHRFMEIFNISAIGEFKYNQRLQVKDIIERMAEIEKAAVIPNPSARAAPANYKANTAIKGHHAVSNLIKDMINFAADSKTGDHSIDFVIPESNHYFYSELLNSYLRHPQLKIRHIIDFTKKGNLLHHGNRNLELLSQILPFAYFSGASYTPYYYYRDNSYPVPTEIFPYFIITKTKAALFDRTFASALYLNKPDLVALQKELFEKMLTDTKPLITHALTGYEALTTVYKAHGVDELDTPTHWVGLDVVIKPFITEELFRAAIKADLPGREAILELGAAHWRYMSKNNREGVTVATVEGIEMFANTGYISGGHPEIAHPVKPQGIADILGKLKTSIEDPGIRNYLANPARFTIPKYTLFAINAVYGLYLMIVSEAGNFQMVKIQEESITEAFEDFVTSIGASDLVYSVKDALSALNFTPQPQ